MPGVVHDQAGFFEHRVTDDAVDVRATQKTLVLPAHAGGGKRHLEAAQPELLQAHDGPVQLADQPGPDWRIDRWRYPGEPVLLAERRREDETQARRTGVEQQPGRDRPAAGDLHRSAQEREVRVRREAHRGAVACVVIVRRVEQPHPPQRVIDLHHEPLQHVVPDEAALRPSARLAQTAEAVERHAIVLELEVAQAQGLHHSRGRRVRGGDARGGGPIAVEPGAREARVEHQPRGIAVDHPGHVNGAPVRVERDGRQGHRGCDRRAVQACGRYAPRERHRASRPPQCHFLRRASATTRAAAPSIPSRAVLTMRS